MNTRKWEFEIMGGVGRPVFVQPTFAVTGAVGVHCGVGGAY